jgi:sulfofructose kinase
MTGTQKLEEGLRLAARHHTGFLAVTDGEKGVYALESGEIRHYPAFPVQAVDTLGAGDVWHGAFTLGLGEGMPAAAAILFASAAAAIKCSRPGGSSGTPERFEVEQFLAAHSVKPEQSSKPI